MHPQSLQQVVAAQLCSGCGMCAGLDARITMRDVVDHGRRPLLPIAPDDAAQQRLLRACPGARLPREETDDPTDDLERDWGPVLEVWEGHASDEEIRYRASSGGAATALALWAVERGGRSAVAHVAAGSVPWTNETVVSRSRDEVLRGLGSRYAPASPCERLPELVSEGRPGVLVAKPCDVAAARAAAQGDPGLDGALSLTVAVFCAGVPSTRGTLRMLETMGVDPTSDEISSLRYRGHGWPGDATVDATRQDGSPFSRTLTYQQSWGEVLSGHRQWRCHLCPDHTGEFADVSVGDPWYRDVTGDPGRSLVVVRTEAGRAAVAGAIADGYLTLQRVANDRLPASQPNLLRTRGAVFGRTWAMRLAGYPVPSYPGFELGALWWRLSPRARLQSVVGTWRRLRRRSVARR